MFYHVLKTFEVCSLCSLKAKGRHGFTTSSNSWRLSASASTNCWMWQFCILTCQLQILSARVGLSTACIGHVVPKLPSRWSCQYPDIHVQAFVKSNSFSHYMSHIRWNPPSELTVMFSTSFLATFRIFRKEHTVHGIEVAIAVM